MSLEFEALLRDRYDLTPRTETHAVPEKGWTVTTVEGYPQESHAAAVDRLNAERDRLAQMARELSAQMQGVQ